MITLTDTQATRLSENGTLTIVHPLPEQPPEGYRCEGISNDGNVVFTNNTHYQDPNREQLDIKIQFPVGKEVKCKEPWGSLISNNTKQYLYRSSCGKHAVYRNGENAIWAGSMTSTSYSDYERPNLDYPWQPASTMPDEAVRFHTTVTANRVCPVQEVTEEEVESMGFSIVNPPPKGYFNSLYAKPVMRVVDGKKQYVAWAWGWDSWEQSYGQNDKYEEYSYNGVLCQYWDKLKITVHCNPFVEIVTVNTEEN